MGTTILDLSLRALKPWSDLQGENSRLLDAYFTWSLYRQLLGKPVDYWDIEWVDPEYYNSLIWILENDPTALDLTFSTEADGVNPPI